MPRKKVEAVEAAQVVEETPEATEEQAAPVEEVPEPGEQAEPQRKPLPDERRCPSHHEFFADESDVRPLTEFRVTAEGKVHPTYCKRCVSKLSSQRRKEQAAQKYTVGAWADDLASLLRRALNEGFLLEAMADEVNALLERDPR